VRHAGNIARHAFGNVAALVARLIESRKRSVIILSSLITGTVV
jgi:hypothetical protein